MAITKGDSRDWEDAEVYEPPKVSIDDASPEDWDNVTAVTASAKDTGEHYRFSITVRLNQKDIQRGEVTVSLDPFRLAKVYAINDAPQFTMLKKVLALGDRGYKNEIQDLDDIITAAARKKQMLIEEGYGSDSLSKPRITYGRG